MNYRNTPPQCVKYDNFVSLGYFCSVASELERIGLRSCSGPFDWQASRSFKLRIKQIDDGFAEFFEGLTEDRLQQKEELPHQYFHPLIDTWLVHDFDKHNPLSDQLPKVIKKYERRVSNFYNNIKKPTLFLHYIYNMEDAVWIKDNYSYIIKVLRQHNVNNDIVFISNKDIYVEGINNLFLVDPDKNDIVARKFLKKTPELRHFLIKASTIPVQRRLINKFYYYRSEFRKKALRIKNSKEGEPVYHHFIIYND